MSKTNGLMKNTLIISVGKISTQIISFLLLPLYTARISTVDYGNADFVISVATFVVPFLTLLLEESMFRFLIDARNEKEKGSIISHTFIISGLNTLFLSIIYWIVMNIVNYELSFSIWIYCIASVLIALSNAFARGTGNIPIYSFSNFIASITTILFNLLFILVFHWEFEALIVSGVIANTLAALFVYAKIHIFRYLKFDKINKVLIRKMLIYSAPLVPNTISWGIINVSDRLVIINTLGASANGLYSIAYKFPNLIYTFYSFFVIAWKETSAKMVKDNDFSEMEKITKTITGLLFSVTALLISGIRFIYPIFIDKVYWKGLEVIPILAISVFYSSLAGYIGGIFTAYKDTKILGSTSFISAIINLIIDVCFIKIIGIRAAAISTLIASLFLYLYRAVHVQKYVKFLSLYDVVYIAIFVVLLTIFYIDVLLISIVCFCISIIITIVLNYKMCLKILFKLKKFVHI